MSAFIDLGEIMVIILSNIFFSVPERLSDHVSRATQFPFSVFSAHACWDCTLLSFRFLFLSSRHHPLGFSQV